MSTTQWSKLSPNDPSSYARPDLSLVVHAILNLAVDFERHVLRGNVVLDVKAVKDINEIILDASDLSLENIELDGKSLEYTLTDEVKDIGSKLTIKLNETAKAGQILKLKISYETSPKARALQWLGPEQTSGKVHPYLFSQCQPMHARTVLPCQDSPSVKFTYEASITAPAVFTVLMSALRRGHEEVAEGAKMHRFQQPVPVPSYLLALAVGQLESRELGPRSSVWAEKAEVDKAAWEFAETELMLQAAERLCGPYEWTRYDLLVLPPSFPYGGMENPCLTFVTPTLLAGDRSLADVIVHEIMHSWSGNLVTNCNFEHFWLNEGFTVFLERKVAASLVPNAEDGKRSRDFHSLLGLQDLKETINGHLGAENPLTKLVVDLNGVHPDDAFSSVPYEKGSTFLRYLEDLVGGPSVFDEFLRAYFGEFKFQCLDTEQFKSYFLEYFSSEPAVSAIDWNGWLNKPGLPIVVPNYDTTMAKVCTELAARWHNEPISTFTSDDLKTFTPQQIIKFLQELLELDPLPLDKLQAMGDLYKLQESGNCEIKFRWIRLGLRAKWEQKIDDALNFVNSQGRMKYVRPVYREMYAWEVSRPKALKNFKQNEKYMMHVCVYTVRKDLHL